MNTLQTDAEPGSGSATAAVQSLLGRVANLCVLGQVSESEAISLFKSVYADAVRKIREHEATHADYHADTFLAAQVLSDWHQDTAYLDRSGNPRTLSAAEFEMLCRNASARSNASQILRLLEEAGVVSIAGDKISARRRDVIMDYAHPSAVTRAIQLSSEFAATLHHNLSRDIRDPGLFERTVVTTKLPARQIPALLAYLRIHGQSFLEDLDAWMSARESDRAAPTVGVGLYLFVGADAPGQSKS